MLAIDSAKARFSTPAWATIVDTHGRHARPQSCIEQGETNIGAVSAARNNQWMALVAMTAPANLSTEYGHALNRSRPVATLSCKHCLESALAFLGNCSKYVR
eukprot:3735080-Karenia_brevis.AAC.1